MLTEKSENVFEFSLSRKERLAVFVGVSSLAPIFTLICWFLVYEFANAIVPRNIALPINVGTGAIFFLVCLQVFRRYRLNNFYTDVYVITNESIERRTMHSVLLQQGFWNELLEVHGGMRKMGKLSPFLSPYLFATDPTYLKFASGERVIVCPKGRGMYEFFEPLLKACVDVSNETSVIADAFFDLQQRIEK